MEVIFSVNKNFGQPKWSIYGISDACTNDFGHRKKNSSTHFVTAAPWLPSPSLATFLNSRICRFAFTHICAMLHFWFVWLVDFHCQSHFAESTHCKLYLRWNLLCISELAELPMPFGCEYPFDLCNWSVFLCKPTLICETNERRILIGKQWILVPPPLKLYTIVAGSSSFQAL